MTDLKFKIIGSNEIREKLFKKLLKNPDYILILDLDKVLKND